MLYLRAFLALLLFPRHRKPTDIKTVVVLQTMKMGDMICTTPLFHALKKQIPGVRVVVLGDTAGKDTLAGSSDVDRYVVYTESALSQVAKEIASEQIDVAILPGPNPKGLAFFALSNARMIIAPRVVNGWSAYEGKAYKLLRIFVATMSHRIGSYAPREYLKLLEPLGIHEEDTKKHLVYSDLAAQRVSEVLMEEGVREGDILVGISPSSGNKIKRWPLDRFARVAEYLSKKDARVIVIGGSRDTEEVEEMLAHLTSDANVINLLEKFSIEELKALIARLNLFIAVDTGPIYIAEAFNVPTIDIVGPMDENEQPPRGKHHLVVAPPSPRTPQLHIMNASIYDANEARRQTEEITVAQVEEAIEKIMLHPRA